MVDGKRAGRPGDGLSSGPAPVDNGWEELRDGAGLNLTGLGPEYLLESLVRLAPDHLFAKDSKGRFLMASPSLAADLGLEWASLIGKTDFDLLPDAVAARNLADEREIMRTGMLKVHDEEPFVTSSGKTKWLITTRTPLRNPEGRVVGILGHARDVSDRKRAEAALESSESRWKFALEGAGQGVWDHDLERGTAYYSAMWRQMRGIGPDETVDPSVGAWLARVHPEDRARLAEETRRQDSGERSHNAFEYRERHRDGHYIWILSRGKPVEWRPDGSVARIIGTDTDITSIKLAEFKAAEEKERTYRLHVAALEKAHASAEAAHRMAESLARHDPLTALPNRRMFSEELDRAIVRATDGREHSALLLIDLDHFKPVNDGHGHAAGDLVLCEIATRLRNLVTDNDTVARLGGDEFGMIVTRNPQVELSADASQIAERIIECVKQPIVINGQVLHVGATIGIAACPTDGTVSDTLLRAADMALYEAKADGRGTFRHYTPSMENALRDGIMLEQELRAAVVNGEIEPHYQPVVRLDEQRLVGFEILARWCHPQRGDISPAIFIPVAEKLGLIKDLTYRVLHRACCDAMHWPSDLSLSLNISPLHLSDPYLPVKLLGILSDIGFPPDRLEVEVAESSLPEDGAIAQSVISALQEIGIKVSLDDFGSSYSNLYKLRELNFDKIKIDRAFITSMQSNADGAKIVSAVIELARNLGLPVIAEGIEEQWNADEISRCGGEFGQGYLFGKAMPAAEALIRAKRASSGPWRL